ncbi:META domain-containing protein [Aliisedimentitalea scapharcae]|uniref:META domain-containing protein n=1 Tax=Aliisedimentitalea scapharcae TaxID=1524259 RepID=A0ABZ2XU42_9RHOB
MRFMMILAFLIPGACQSDETVSGYGGGDRVWTLVEIDGQPFASRATLTFPDRGQIAGQAPCNRYSAIMEAPYPWFDTGPVIATRMACPDLDAEDLFLSTLDAMTESEVSGNTLVLRAEDGREMLFKADE